MSVVANVAINVDSRNAVTKLRQVQSQSQATERAVNGLGAAVGKLAAAFSAIQAARFVFVQTAELEKQTRSLEVLTGSATKAAQIIKELKDIGAVTPFTSTELIDSAKRLQAFGVETNKVVETTRRLADVSGATGAELQGLVTAYGQVQAKGRLQGEELLQFQERGVALQQVLREEYKLSGEEFQDALSKGRISAEAVEYAIQKLTDAGGKYANGAIAQSDTLAGRLSTLQDAVQNLAQRLGTILAPAMQSILGLAIDIANQINNVFETILLQRQLGANLSPAMRDRLFKQAGQEAEQIARLRGGGRIDAAQFTKLREERFRDLMRTFGYEQGIFTPPTAAPPSASATLPSLMEATGKGKGKKGKSDAERAAEKAARQEAQVQSQLANLRIETEATKQLAVLRGRIAEAQIAGDEQLVERLRGVEREQQIVVGLQQALEGVTDERIKQALEAKALADLEAAGIETASALEQLAVNRAKAIQDAIAPIQEENGLLQATLDGKREEYELEKKIADLIKQNVAPEQARRLVQTNQRLKEQNDTINKQKQLWADIYSTVAGELQQSITGLIDGTKEWGDVLSNILGSLGNLFLNAAFSGLGSALKLPGFAEGGFVTKPTAAVVGEGSEPEYIIPASKMRTAMGRYAGGARGDSVVSGDGVQTAAAGGGAATMEPIDVRYSVERINNVDYVTADQFQRGMAQAAQQGAVQGERRVLRTLQGSAATRKRIGV